MSKMPNAAPRLRAYLNATKRALIMLRRDWDALITGTSSPVEIEVEDLPIGNISAKSKVVGTFAQKKSPDETRILVFREDQQDAPFIINLDRYPVLEDFRGRDDYEEMVTSADTDDDQPMRDFHNEYVIIVPEEKARGHHLLDLPGIYKARVKQGS
jgi:hypothetical protein